MTISKPFKGLAVGQKQHENASHYTRVFYGDTNLCEQWITYAQNILQQMLLRPGTNSRRVMATPDVEVYVTSRPNRIEIRAGGILYVCGTNTYSMLGVNDGHGSIDPYAWPVYVAKFPQQLLKTDETVTIPPKKSGLRFIRAMMSNARPGSSLGIGVDGFLYIWGFNSLPELVAYTIDGYYLKNPTRVTSSGSNFVEIDAGYGYYFALKRNSDLYAWGYNSDGQLGLGSGSEGLIYDVRFVGGNYKKISARTSFSHTVALKTDGKVLVSGTGSLPGNHLGLGSTVTTNGDFVEIYNNCKEISCGYMVTYMITNDNELYGCGGYNNTLGAASGASDTPTLIGTDFIKVAAGLNGSMAIKSNGDLYAWGENTALPPPGLYEALPTKIGEGFVDAAINYAAFALKKNGDLYAWGIDDLYQTGVNGIPHGSNLIIYTPTLIAKGVKYMDTNGLFGSFFIK